LLTSVNKFGKHFRKVTTQAWFWKHHRWQHRLILAKILHIWDGYVWQTIAISAFLVTGGGFCSSRLSSYFASTLELIIISKISKIAKVGEKTQKPAFQ
jgi:hypothetical protein